MSKQDKKVNPAEAKRISHAYKPHFPLKRWNKKEPPVTLIGCALVSFLSFLINQLIKI